MKLFNLLETQYSQFSNAVKSYLSKTLSNYEAQYGNSTIFGQLINVLTGTVQNIMLYIEDALTEQNKYTAQRKKSVYGLAVQSGYQPSLGKASGVQLKVMFVPNSAGTANVVIKNKEQLTCTQNGLQYNIILPQESIVMSPSRDVSSRTMYAVQGHFETQTFTATGGKYYTQNVKFQGNMDVTYTEVWVNGEKWERAESVYDMVPDGKQYVVKTSYSTGVDLVFGNDQYGQALDKGDIVKVTYLVHDGNSGNLSTDVVSYFVFNNPLSDTSGDTIDGNNMFNVTFADLDAVTSGTDSEPLEQVRQLIGLNSRSLVLASPENFKEYLSKFSFVGYNNTWADPGSMIVNSLIMKNYQANLKEGNDYFKLTMNDFLLSDAQKSSLKNSLVQSGNMLAGVVYNIYNPQIWKYACYIYLNLKSNAYEPEFIKSQIRDLVGKYFGSISFNQFVPKSDIIHLIKDNVKGVDGVNVYFISCENEKALINHQYEDITQYYDQSTGTYKTKKETVYVYSGENPDLGLDDHGNISLSQRGQFPVLMGGWNYLNDLGQQVAVTEPLNIVFK